MRALILLFLLLLPQFVSAANNRVIGMNERVFKALNEAQTQMDEKNYQAAQDGLQSLLERRLSFYEKAQVQRLLGHVYYQTEDYDAARGIYEETLAEERLPDSFVASVLGMLGRLGLIQDDFEFAIENFKALMEIRGYDNPTNRVMMASAYMQQEKWGEAESLILSAIEQEVQAEQLPREQWLLMLTSCYYSQERYDDTSRVLNQIVELYPSERHLMNLAAIYGQMGERQKQLSLVEALLDDDRISEDRHIRMLVSLYMAEGLPFKAARLMEASLAAGNVERTRKNLEQLSQSWYLAGNIMKSLPPLREAAELADDGKVYMRLAQLHMDAYQWKQAEETARIALEKGDLRSEGRAWLIRGMAMAHQQFLDDARDRFEQAAEFEDSEKYANQWIAFVENEQNLASVGGGED